MNSETAEHKAPSLTACMRSGYDRHVSCVSRLDGEPLENLERALVLMHQTLKKGGKVLACGNGGSASDAQHLAAELVGRYHNERPALAAISLNAQRSVLTCLANDYDYEHVFSRQVEALGRPGDLLVVISASGRSPNILRALETARRQGLETVSLLGRDGGPAKTLTRLAVVVPDQDRPHSGVSRADDSPALRRARFAS